MYDLAIVYEWRKPYDLACKYFEMAAEHGYKDAYIGLAYIWYYGRTGKTDYEKAFYWFSKAGDDINAQYKIADMYKNGYYVEKDMQKYREIIEHLYKEYYYSTDDWNDASLGIRLAEIRSNDRKRTKLSSCCLKQKSRLCGALAKTPSSAATVYKEDSRYGEYENLLLERDRYRKEANMILKRYIMIFGERITAIFKQKIACIEKKKMLTWNDFMKDSF